MTGFLQVSLYVIGGWFAIAAGVFVIFAANRSGRGFRASLLVLSVMAVIVSVVLMLAAGDLR